MPLSSAQKMVYFDQLINPDLPHYNIGFKFQLSGELNYTAIEKTLEILALQNPSLRTHFYIKDDIAFQQVQLRVDIPLVGKDFSDTENPREAANNYLQNLFETTFELYGGVLWRAAIVKVNPTEHYFICFFHHLIADGYSTAICITNFIRCYNQLIRGIDQELISDHSYFDYLQDDQNYLLSERYQRDSIFWRNQFQAVPDSIFPPRFGTPINVKSSSLKKFNISRALYVQLQHQLSEEKIPLASFFVAVVATCLSRIYRLQELAIGVPVHNRLKAKYKNTIGMFSTVVPVSIAIDMEQSFFELSKQISTQLVGAYRHQRFPVSDINRMCNLVESGRRRLYDVSVSFEEYDVDYQMDNCSFKASRVDEYYEQTPLSISVLDSCKQEDDVELLLYCNLSYVDDSLGTSLGSRFGFMIERLVDDLSLPLKHVPIMLDAERYRLLYQFNETEVAYPHDRCIHQLFEIQAQQHSKCTALEYGDTSLSYAELNAKANQLAHYLMAAGIQPGNCIGIYLPRSLDAFISLLAILKAGGAYVMLEVSNPVERIRQMCGQASLKTILTTQSQHQGVAVELDVTAKPVYLDAPEVYSALESCTTHNPRVELLSGSPAFVYFTSGSTGTPKGALNSHQNAVSTMSAMARELALTPDDRVLQWAALGFDVVLEEVFPAWFSGAAVVLRDEEGVLSAAQLQGMLQRHRISVCELMSSYWAHWVEYLHLRNQRPPDSLRLLLLGSDRVAIPVYELWQGYGIPILNVFGLSETACTSLVYRAEGPQAYRDYLPNGRPLANTLIYVLDSSGQPVPEQVTGELYIGGAGVGLGYVGEPVLTAERFIDNPFAPGRLYKTGDQARWLADGNLVF
ncbi:MAG: AMP-binding protein, partial [Pseudomonadota bacterium]